MAIKTWLHGSSGKMGQELQQAILQNRQDFLLTGGSSEIFEGSSLHQGQKVSAEKLAQFLKDVSLVLDFSTVEGNETLLSACQLIKDHKLALLIGTTGLTDDRKNKWQTLTKESKNFRSLIAPNTSLGIMILLKACLITSQLLNDKQFDIEIIETHHRQKKDAPSGTALFIGQSLAEVSEKKISVGHKELRKNDNIGIHSVRGGSVFGRHEVLFLGDHEELHFSHQALSRKLFAQGALVLAKWLLDQKKGSYTLTDMIRSI